MSETLTLIGYGDGIGHGAAKAFAEAGFHLNLVCRHPEEHDRISELQALGIEVNIKAADAGDTASLSLALDQLETQQPCDAMLYNAVSARFSSPSELTAELLAEDLKVDVCGALTAVNFIAPRMLQRGKGSLLFTGGDWAHFPKQSAASMAIGKAGLRILALMLAQQYRETCLNVGLLSIMGAVAPGSPLAPEHIGKVFLNMHQHPENEHLTEHRFHGPDWINP